MTKPKYDIFFLVESGIGNALEMLYAVEYCLCNNIKAGIFLNRISGSFTNYLRECYGVDVIVESTVGISTVNLVQSFTYQDKNDIQFDHYFYVKPDEHSTKYLSETEQFLSIVKSVYPSDYSSPVLTMLQEDYSDRVKAIKPGEKTVLYPGCSSLYPIKRWPYFDELIKQLGADNVIVVGGNDDINYTYSYYYPKWITSIFGRFFTRRNSFFNMAKKLGILHSHAQYHGIEKESYSYFNVFSWAELVALFRRTKNFVGNDGGITHLAAVCGAGGYVVFGPSSVEKNKPVNNKIVPISRKFDCQPCQFNTGGNIMSRYAIVCPYQLRCLYSIKADEIAEKIKNSIKERVNV